VRFLGLSKPANLLMELLDGPNLSQVIHRQAKKQLSVSDAVRVTIHLGAALAFAHSKGVLHLDVKPYNVIVAPGGRPVLYDFGSARFEGAPRPSLVARSFARAALPADQGAAGASSIAQAGRAGDPR